MKEISQDMIDQIEEMRAKGHSIKKIARALGKSRNTVRKYLRSEDIDAVQVLESEDTDNCFDIDAAVRERSLGRPLKRIYEELNPSICYSYFCKVLAKSQPVTPTAAVRLYHEPGEKAQVDYADGLKIIDRETGRETKTQFFCGVLPSSSYTFGEFSLTQGLSDFIRSHERMWSYFGGVAKYVVLDNLKSGVTKAHRYDPDVNPTYCDFANHCGFAALPARVRTPRDKATVECTIGVVQRDFFDRHRATKFYSLEELNRCFRAYLDDFNSRTMEDYGCSRKDRFKIEAPILKPLPEAVYELFEWRKAKVHPDSCIEIMRSVYSVPYAYIHKTVQVKLSDRMVIVLNETGTETIATHARKPKYKHSILDTHLPPYKLQKECFDVKRIEKIASIIGPGTLQYVEWQFKEDDYPLRALRRLQGLVRFYQTEKVPNEAMEYAAGQAFQFKQKKLRYFENCAKAFTAQGSRLQIVSAPLRDPANIHLQH